MIYLDSDTLYIPKPWEAPSADRFELVNNVGLQVYSEAVELTEGPLYFSGQMAFDLPDGEYTYRLMAGEEIISEGLAIKGDYTPDRTEFEKTIEYEQYGS